MPVPSSVIDDVQWLYVGGISEPRENDLRILLEEARVAPSKADLPVVGPHSTYGAIVHDETCRVFEVRFLPVVAYLVTNETYPNPDKDYDRFTGQKFRHYSRSRYLDFIRKSTVDFSDVWGPLRHWGIACLNNIIDVVSQKDPVIEILREGDKG
jgi:hypothetical protein